MDITQNNQSVVLSNFDKFPDSAQVRLPIVKVLFGISSATVWRMVKAGKLRSYKLTEGTTTFNVGELRLLLPHKNINPSVSHERIEV